MAIGHLLLHGLGNFADVAGSPPDAPTLAVSDNEDGTGGVATVTGSAAGVTNTLYRQGFDGEIGTGVWVEVEDRDGNGTIPIVDSISGIEFYLWKVVATNAQGSNVSNIVYQPLSDGLDPVRTRCMAAIIARLQTRNLTLIGTAVYEHPYEAGPDAILWPACVVIREPVPDQLLGGTNVRDDLGMGFMVLFGVSEPLGTETELDTYDYWMEKGSRLFREQRLPGIPENMTCSIEPLKILDPNRPPGVHAMVKTGFTVRVRTREIRGFSA